MRTKASRRCCFSNPTRFVARVMPTAAANIKASKASPCHVPERSHQRKSMNTVRFSKISGFVLLVLTVLLAGCGGRDDIKKGTSDIAVANAPTTFDLTVAADKDNQFDLDGASLTAQDLRGHIRYRNEPGHQSVRTILLKTGEKEKIKSTHVAALASIARDLKLEAYVRDNDGHLKVIQIVDDKKP